MNKCILKQQLHVARSVMGKRITRKLLDYACLFLFPIGLQIEMPPQIFIPALSISLQWIAYL